MLRVRITCVANGGQHSTKNTFYIIITAGGIECDKVVARDGRSGLGVNHRSLLSWYAACLRFYHNNAIL